MQSMDKKIIVVAGGTGNVGTYVVQSLLERGAQVVVPSRSEQRLDSWRQVLAQRTSAPAREGLRTFVGDLSEEDAAASLLEEIEREVGPPNAALAALGRWHSVLSLLDARPSDFSQVIDDYLVSHHMVARALIENMSDRGGRYVFVNGPLAFENWGTDTALVSIATAAQHMLFRALADEFEDGRSEIAELVTYAFIRNRETQPSSPLPGEAVGAFASHLLSGEAGSIHGESIHVQSLDQVKELGLTLETA